MYEVDFPYTHMLQCMYRVLNKENGKKYVYGVDTVAEIQMIHRCM